MKRLQSRAPSSNLRAVTPYAGTNAHGNPYGGPSTDADGNPNTQARNHDPVAGDHHGGAVPTWLDMTGLALVRAVGHHRAP